MSAFDELREVFFYTEPGAPPVTTWSTSAIIEEINAVEAAHSRPRIKVKRGATFIVDL